MLYTVGLDKIKGEDEFDEGLQDGFASRFVPDVCFKGQSWEIKFKKGPTH